MVGQHWRPQWFPGLWQAYHRAARCSWLHDVILPSAAVRSGAYQQPFVLILQAVGVQPLRSEIRIAPDWPHIFFSIAPCLRSCKTAHHTPEIALIAPQGRGGTLVPDSHSGFN